MQRHFKIALIILSLIFAMSCRGDQGKSLHFETTPDGDVDVILVLKKINADQRAAKIASVTRPVVNEIWEINKEHAYFDYGMSSSSLNDTRHITPFIMVKGCSDLANAETYIHILQKELKKPSMDLVSDIFPISEANYQICAEAREFSSYARFYKDSRN